MDCSTWFLVENQPKMTYPPLPRFSAHIELQCGPIRALGRGLCQLLQLFHVEVAAVLIVKTLRACKSRIDVKGRKH
jgi:hypothetical protein